MTVGRFAPSPSGRMHLGNMLTALVSWLSAKKDNGKWILRIEDLDRGRSKIDYARMIEEDLLWLGLDWDEGGIEDKGNHGPYSQSRRSEIYEEALAKIIDTGLTYPCFCSRADIAAANAPHASQNQWIYPGTCLPAKLGGSLRSENINKGRKPSIRLHLPDKDISFSDRVFGNHTINLSKDFGDIILRRSDGGWAYQMAVVVDDALMGITEVVRGADLLQSSAVQIHLHKLLGYEPPEFMHVPLLCNEEGIRLSKRDESLSMEELKKEFSPSHLTGYLAYLCGIIPEPFPISTKGLLPLYSPTSIKPEQKVIV